jgi:hypothetical protein
MVEAIVPVPEPVISMGEPTVGYVEQVPLSWPVPHSAKNR